MKDICDNPVQDEFKAVAGESLGNASRETFTGTCG